MHGFTQNQIWCEIVALGCELLAWMQMLAFTGPARRWEPKRLRLRIFTCAGRIVRGGRRLRPPPAAPPRRDLALGSRHHSRARAPARTRTQLTSWNSPATRKENTQGPWNPAHPARQPGSQARSGAEKQPPATTSSQPATIAKDRGYSNWQRADI